MTFNELTTIEGLLEFQVYWKGKNQQIEPASEVGFIIVVFIIELHRYI